MECPPYTYRPLDRSRNEIRLLKFENFYRLSNFQYTIKHVSLHDEPVYTALSYVWGDAKHNKPLLIYQNHETYSLSITQNLASALQHIDISGWFWVDAVCINQSNDNEKTRQVQQMWNIFHEADHTAAWLGMADLPDTELIRTMQRSAQSNDTFESFYEYHNLFDVSKFGALTRRPYWRRVWIQQELQASETVWFWCGGNRFSRRDVIFHLDFLHWVEERRLQNRLMVGHRNDIFDDRASALREDVDFRNTTTTIKGHASHSQDAYSPPLRYVLAAAYIWRTGLQASDPRDLVFALLGLSSDASEIGIAADYSKPLKQVFLEVALALITQIGLQVITWKNFTRTSGTPLKIRSWVPDWSQPFLKPLAKFGRNDRRTRFEACAKTTSQSRFITSDEIHPIFCVSGAIVDKIIAVGALNNLILAKSDLRHIQTTYRTQARWLDELQRLSTLYASTHRGFANDDARWRTSVTNLELNKQGKYTLASDSMRRGYYLFVAGTLKHLAKLSDDVILALNYWKMLVAQCAGRRFFLAEKGHLGLGPPDAVPGHDVVILLGLNMPLVLSKNEDGTYKLVGEAYIHGIMDGEAMPGAEVKDLRIV
ncbi:HET-domain-containing protein [Lophium mytilinum]|uniref:HET-domain-containing protein n=1 Tax=Lophium mytilinum TaxID=390894 RepID=A0A6A6QLA9_9PEZI|nr:HET-domain-containing protein [Lophium mytilinum]